jgi:hypothetical protein
VLTGFWLGDPTGRDHWEDLDLGGRIKMKLRDIRIDGANWIRLAQNRVQLAGFYQSVNKPSGSINRVLFDKLSNYQLFKEYTAPRVFYCMI